jgi:hypothetical protein
MAERADEGADTARMRRAERGRWSDKRGTRGCRSTPVSLFWVPRPRLGVGVSSNVKRIRTPTQSRGAWHPTSNSKALSRENEG